MPKVTEEYLNNKRRMILDAAYRQCLEKTVCMVTMLDIIHEAGLSKGGIYRFYKNINELLADLIDRIRQESDFKDRLDFILSNVNEKTYQDTVCDVFQLLGERMEENLMGAEKIDFELNILAMNEPERMKEILSYTKIVGNKEYLAQKTMELFIKAEREGKLRFLIPLTELMDFITSAYSGIQMTCIVNRCYHPASDRDHTRYLPVAQMHILANAVNSYIEVK